jgi:hypothetical protein
LLRCINLLEDYESGTITVDGEPVGYRTDGKGARIRLPERAIAASLKQGWYASSVGGAAARYGEVLGTPIGLSPSQPRGARKLTSTPLS